MVLRYLVLCLAAVAMLLTGGISSAEAKAAKPGEEKAIKVPPEVVELPKIRLAVPLDDNHTFGALELEVWLVMAKPEDAAKLNSAKHRVIDAMKAQFLNYKWEAFAPADSGFDLAKAVVKAAAEGVIPELPVQDVLIRQMILR